MNFVTLEFATFFLFVLVAGWLLRERDGEYRAFLLVCNLFFYALAGMAFVPLLLAVAVLNWGAVHLMSRFSGQPRKRKGVIALDVALHVALLAFFKYYEFLILGLESLASAAGLDTGILRHALPSMEILFPVGLSFYTFQGLSYAIDHYRCPDEPPRAFLDVLLFVSFFPTILAGPIMRARQFLPQVRAPGAAPAAARAPDMGFPRLAGRVRAYPQRAVQEGRDRQLPVRAYRA